MPTPLFIKESDLSPKVILNQEKERFIIVGKSIVENAHEFYKPVVEWFKNYFENPNEKTELIFYFQYINSSSFLQVSNIIDLFSQNLEKNLTIKWLYDEDDDTMEEIGNDLQFTYLVNFNFIELDDNSIKDYNFNI